MKKKSYQKPLMVSEEFVPQEYVAACSPDISWQPSLMLHLIQVIHIFGQTKTIMEFQTPMNKLTPIDIHATTVVHYPMVKKVNMFLKTQVKNAYSLIRPKEILSLFINQIKLLQVIIHDSLELLMKILVFPYNPSSSFFSEQVIGNL